MTQIKSLSWASMWFEVISSLKINMEKRELTPIENIVYVEGLASMLRYRVGKLATTHLGQPL